jgi:uncharacterized protein YkwD
VRSGARQLTPQADYQGDPIRPARIAAACALACIVVALPAPAEAKKSNAGPLMLQKINQVRARHGLGPLRLSPSLRRSSGRFAHWLMATDQFGHRANVSASHRFSRLGEALAMHAGRKPAVRHTVREWLASPPHRRIVLSRGMPWIGLGMSRGRFGSHRAVIWVLQVGKL